jgi:hypothetical protein
MDGPNAYLWQQSRSIGVNLGSPAHRIEKFIGGVAERTSPLNFAFCDCRFGQEQSDETVPTTSCVLVCENVGAFALYPQSTPGTDSGCPQPRKDGPSRRSRLRRGWRLWSRLEPSRTGSPQNEKGPDLQTRAFSDNIPATTYVPTQLPVQYHRPGEA